MTGKGIKYFIIIKCYLLKSFKIVENDYDMNRIISKNPNQDWRKVGVVLILLTLCTSVSAGIFKP